MKILKLLIATLFGVWTIGTAIGVVSQIGAHGGTRGTVELAAGLGVTAGLAAATYWLFEWALRKPSSNA